MRESKQRYAGALSSSPDFPTAEMVEAGVMELRERSLGEALDAIVTDIWVAMSAAYSTNCSASETRPSR